MSFYYLSGLASNLLTASGVTFSGDADDSNYPHENAATGKPWEMMRFAAAGTDDYIHANRTSISPDFCSIHFHNIDSGITAIELRRGATGATLVATMTKASPSFYATFSAVADTDWRLKFVGTNASAIYIGEWVLGVKSTLAKDPRAGGLSIGYRMPQRRVSSPSGLVLAHNLSEHRLRTLRMDFRLLSDSNLTEHLDDMMGDCAWGEEPIVIVPDSGRNWVIHGRPAEALVSTIRPGGLLLDDAIEIMEDPGPLIVK
ncbi:MAG: hypothetical protein JSV16_13350 [Candidatus Hydrogenedentota bacterium]|nr:MAG: hypothetical protein JSV16_13350 [Candidatus Hydrogenedentota bacterium]